MCLWIYSNNTRIHVFTHLTLANPSPLLSTPINPLIPSIPFFTYHPLIPPLSTLIPLFTTPLLLFFSLSNPNPNPNYIVLSYPHLSIGNPRSLQRTQTTRRSRDFSSHRSSTHATNALSRHGVHGT